MKYNNVVKGEFISRPNRFIAKVRIDGEEQTVHVKNTGRCAELLVPGCECYLERAQSPARKTQYDLIAVNKAPVGIINMDSQVVNDAAHEWLLTGELFASEATVRREVRYGASRFDFYIETPHCKVFLEVKGVTLEKDGIAAFPDAPTLRGIKHLNELVSCVSDGYEAYVLFVIQMKGVHAFMPNDETHPAFGEALRAAERAGVHIIVRDCIVTPESICIADEVPIIL